MWENSSIYIFIFRLKLEVRNASVEVFVRKQTWDEKDQTNISGNKIWLLHQFLLYLWLWKELLALKDDDTFQRCWECCTAFWKLRFLCRNNNYWLIESASTSSSVYQSNWTLVHKTWGSKWQSNSFSGKRSKKNPESWRSGKLLLKLSFQFRFYCYPCSNQSKWFCVLTFEPQWATCRQYSPNYA